MADREGLVKSLRDSESLVNTARARVHVRYIPTDASRMEGIENENSRIGESEGSFILSTTEASLLSHSAVWSRRGSMERVDIGEFGDLSGTRKQSSFDGQFIRTLELPSRTAEVPRGSVQTREAAHWDAVNRPYPFGFLFEYQTRSYADLIDRSEVYREETLDVDGQRHTLVRFTHPDVKDLEFELVFDEAGRLIRRVKWKQLRWRGDDRLKRVELHEFFDFEEYEIGSDRKLAFPQRAVYTSYTGEDREGRPIEFMKKEITLENLEFNVEIPTSHFSLEFPDNAAILYEGANSNIQ